jgi:hypothetical protein
MAMVITRCACFLTLCALLLLMPLGGALADPALKPVITGLISTGSKTNTLDEFTDRGGIFGGVVVQATWRDLQPGSSANFNTKVIEDALKNVRAYNSTYPNQPLGVRLRIFAGCSDSDNDAPDWALRLDGDPVTMKAYYSTTSTPNGDVPYYETCRTGHFWDHGSKYAAAWRQFQIQLAAEYDTHPLIREIAVTSCTSFSAEPFFLPYEHVGATNEPLPDTTEPALGKAGYTNATYQDCLANAVSDYEPWQTTRLEYTFNPFYGLTEKGDIAFSERVMRGCRQTAGLRCILSNHDLDSKTPDGILPIYALERKFGPNITFQSYVGQPTDLEGTLRKGISLGAGAIEIWPKGFETKTEPNLTNATLESWAAMFQPQ